jgi:hypothetical protein
MMPDDFSDSFYYRAIRTKIGEALRNRLVSKEPPPKRLLDLLHALDQPGRCRRDRGEAGTSGTEARRVSSRTGAHRATRADDTGFGRKRGGRCPPWEPRIIPVLPGSKGMLAAVRMEIAPPWPATVAIAETR